MNWTCSTVNAMRWIYKRLVGIQCINLNWNHFAFCFLSRLYCSPLKTFVTQAKTKSTQATRIPTKTAVLPAGPGTKSQTSLILIWHLLQWKTVVKSYLCCSLWLWRSTFPDSQGCSLYTCIAAHHVHHPELFPSLCQDGCFLQKSTQRLKRVDSDWNPLSTAAVQTCWSCCCCCSPGRWQWVWQPFLCGDKIQC